MPQIERSAVLELTMKTAPMEWMDAYLAGERPDRIPYTMYWFFAGDKPGENPEWQKLFQRGFRLTYGFGLTHHNTPGLQWQNKTWIENGNSMSRDWAVTPVGEIQTISRNGWRQEYLLKTAADYRVMTWMAENTHITPAFASRAEAFKAFTETQEREAGFAILGSHIFRTPIQRILVDCVGLENFAYHLVDLEAEMMELYAAMLRNFETEVAIVADGPGTYVSCLENFTAETMGPERFRQFLLPVYKKCFPILQQAGKVVGTHYDGKLISCKDVIAEAPTRLIESLTPPPEGDMTLKQCRQAWPDKLFWVNINVSAYSLPRAELKAYVHRLIDEGAPDGRRLAFEVSEDLPTNWRESIPVVLDAIEERGGK